MVYGFTQRYGGDILLESNPGEGAIFRIYLPRVKDENTMIPGTSETGKEKAYKNGNEKILVVDDEAPLLAYAEQILENWGYTVFCANSAADALVILKKEPIDLLFSDVVMPGGMNGYELAEKAQELNPQLKILITSGYADKFGGNEKYEKYGFELISKPYNREELADRLRYLLDNQ
jgi:CheY-like chemotaxis protein